MRTDWQSPHEIPPVRVLRLTLRGPLTLGHVLLLDELGNPIVKGEPLDLGELSVAVLVCSMTVEQARKALRSRWAWLPMKLWGWKCGRLNFAEEADRFFDWFHAQTGGPTVDTAECGKDSKPITSPWYVYKLAVAVGQLGLSIPDAEALPIKRLNQLIGAFAESQGSVKFVTEEIDRANEIIEQAEKRMLEQLKGKTE